MEVEPTERLEGSHSRLRWLRWAAGIALAVLALGFVGGAGASRLEENDRFCASCHMVPERTYFNRAQFALAGIDPVEDLSSAHYLADPEDLPAGVPMRCIDCHRGDDSLLHRTEALLLGAEDTVIYLFGDPDQSIEKTELNVPHLANDSCVMCHSAALLEVGFPNHFHNMLPVAADVWQDGGELTLPQTNPELYEDALEEGLEPIEDSDLLCMDCHQTHVSKPGAELTGFLDLDNVAYPACETCHTAALGAPLGIAP
ncbi:MAG: hypothetical protein GYB68_06240 [Chloroflexi bacterium]|nr:hypothetical protein [Chloroflexota bacterium]